MKNYTELGKVHEQFSEQVKGLHHTLWTWQRTVRGVIAPLCIVDGFTLLFWAWQEREWGIDQTTRFFTHWGVGFALGGVALVCVGIHLLCETGVDGIRKKLRERVLAYEFEESEETAIWAHVTTRSTGGLEKEFGDEHAPASVLGPGCVEYFRFVLLFAVSVANGIFFWHNFYLLPDRDPRGRLNLAMHVVAWAELLGFSLIVAKATTQAIVALIRGGMGADTFHSQLIVASWCDNFSVDLQLTRRFSTLMLLSFLTPEDMVEFAKRAFWKQCKLYEKAGVEHSGLVALIVALFAAVGWLALAALGVGALLIKLNQVAFALQASPEEWTSWNWFALLCFANLLHGIMDIDAAERQALAAALADIVDVDVAADNLADQGSRFSAWRRSVIGHVFVEHGSFSAIVFASTARTKQFSDLLFRAKAVKVGDTVIAIEPCCASIEERGVLKQLDPVPIVEWTNRKLQVNAKVELSGLKNAGSGRQKELANANGVYSYHNLKEHSWPIYINEDHSWVLVPEIGNPAQPGAVGWSLTEAYRLLAGKGVGPPRYCGVPVAWTDGQHQMDPTGGQWFLNEFSGVGHSAKDAIKCLPCTDPTQARMLPAQWGVSLAQIRREMPFFVGEEVTVSQRR